MWEAIQSNRRNSWLLISLMGLVLVLLGFFVGASAAPEGGAVGVLVALALWLGLWAVSSLAGDQILLSSASARRVEKKADAPQLWNVLEEMTIASGMGSMPKLYVIENDAPNAFAVGRSQSSAAVAVTSGLLKRLNRDELQGVIAHEISHVKNLDVRFLTLASVMLGVTIIISDVFLRSLRFGGGRRSMGRGKGGQGQAIILLIAVLVAILAPIMARILYFACSRRREYLADASAARFTRYPEGLASALEKIAQTKGGFQDANRAIAPLFIVNPFQGVDSSSIFATHPSVTQRIRILRSMGGMAGYRAYDEAFRKVSGKKASVVGNAALKLEGAISARKPSPESTSKESAIERAKEVTGLLDQLGNLFLIACACGLKIKVPPEMGRVSLKCPRCGRPHEAHASKSSVPSAPSAPSPVAAPPESGGPPAAASP